MWLFEIKKRNNSTTNYEKAKTMSFIAKHVNRHSSTIIVVAGNVVNSTVQHIRRYGEKLASDILF